MLMFKTIQEIGKKYFKKSISCWEILPNQEMKAKNHENNWQMYLIKILRHKKFKQLNNRLLLETKLNAYNH